MNLATDRKITQDLLRPLTGTSGKYYAAVGLLGAVTLMGLVAWGYQMYYGIGLTGLNSPVFWGFYLVNFVFWIGISHAGTLISAILRLIDAPWRRPVTRCAEAITAFALVIGGTLPLIHLGRPWLFFYLIPFPDGRGLWPNFRSPLMWDFFAINTYLLASTLFLFLPMIPDFALVRDRATGIRRTIYGALSVGWRGTPKQWHRLESAMQIMAIAIIPVAVSVHTIVSFDFAIGVVAVLALTGCDGGGSDVAFDGIRPLLRGGRHLQRNRRPDHRHGDTAPGVAVGAVPEGASFPEAWAVAATDEFVVGILRVLGASDDLVWQRQPRDACVLGHVHWRIRALLLGHGRV